MVNLLIAILVIAPVFGTSFEAIKISYSQTAWFTVSIKLAHNFLMFVVKKCTMALYFILLVLSPCQLTEVHAFKINGVQVSEFPLLLLANPVDAGVEQLLVVLDLGDTSIVKYNLGVLFLKTLFHLFVSVD